MKLIIDARTLGSRPSGIGIYLYDFIKELATNKDFNILLVTDVAESEQIKHLHSLGLPILCYGKRIFRSVGVISYFRYINRILHEEQPDIFWEPNNLIPIKLRNFNGKIVLTIHDLFPITEPNNFSWIYRIYFKLGIRKTIRYVDALLFNSIETQNETLTRFPQARKKASFISYLIIKNSPPRIISDENFILYVGNLERRKGTDLLLSAYEMYLEQNGTRSLYLGGNIREESIGKQLNTLQQKTDKIHYLGYLSEEQKYDLLSKCSCFVFPTRAEGFGIPPLEALGYNKPIISSNLSVFKEVLPLPIDTFDLSKTKSEQIQDLCQLISKEKFAGFSSDDCQRILCAYDSNILGKKLSAFFINLMEETK